MKNLIYFITAAVLLFSAAAFVSPNASTSETRIIVPKKSFIVTGKVTDYNGEALIGASILEKGTTNGTVTDLEGKYSLSLKHEKATLVISYTGFQTQEILMGKSKIVDVALQQGVTLDECVVTAIGIEKEARCIGYSVQSVPKRSKKARKKDKAYRNALSGRVTGVQATPQKVKIRGSRSVPTDYHVDGVKVKNYRTPETKAQEPTKVKAPKSQPAPPTPLPAQPISKPATPTPAPAPPASKPAEPKTVPVADKAEVQDKKEAKNAVSVPKDSIVDYSAERYDEIYENPFLQAKKTPLSTFSIDVDAASYSNMRRFVSNGSLPPKDAIRIEEMVNYFNYDYPEPTGEHPFEIITEISDCPWQKGHKLLHIGLQGKRVAKEDLPASNLVFLIDVSGSMNRPNKLPLLQQSLNLLVDNLRQKDFVSIVVYAGSAGVVLNPTNGTNKKVIKDAINRLRAGGSTAGGAGIKLAYKLARENFNKKGNNRVIIATDGDFNVGISSDINLVKLIEKERESGVFLTVLGFGMGNYQDGKMQKLADKGNGNHAYIDNIGEAQKVLINEFGGTIFAIAKDVKLQLEFNPEQVKGYRLIGYENRLLADEDFDDDTKDAGEMGAGHTVTALYEIIPANYQTPYIADIQDTQQRVEPVKAFSGAKKDMVHIKFRYKKPDGHKSKLLEKGATDMNIPLEKSSDNFRWSASVAQFGLLLRDSKYKGKANWRNLKTMAEKSKGKDPNGYRGEMILLIDQAQKLSRKPLAGK
jgi:Ca-activated chloride channel family protein